MNQPVYRLERSLHSTLRLNLQQYLLNRLLGYNLHPSISVHDPQLHVADVGTGTGIFLSELVLALPSTARCDGYDVSSDQFPHQHSLPANVRLSVCDATRQPPAELREKYDVVHIRLFKPVVNNNDPGPVIEHAKALLKPGGYLQWSEFDTVTMRMIGVNSPETQEAVDHVFDILKGNGEEWLPELPTTLTKAGLDIIAVDRRRLPPWLRQPMLENHCNVAVEKAAMRLRLGECDNDSYEKTVKAVQRTVEEGKRVGLWFDVAWQVAVARKGDSR